MKKIIMFILFIVILSGCNKDKEITKKEISNKKEETISPKKYYSYAVPIYDHDDYKIENKKSYKNISNLNYKNTYDSSNDSNEKEIVNNNITGNDDTDKENSLIKENLENEEDEKGKLTEKEDNLNDTKEKINGEKEDSLNDTKEKINEEKEDSLNDIKEKINEEKEEKNREDNKKILSPTLDDTKEKLKEDKKEDNKDKMRKGYYSPSGKYLGTTNVKVIDVSYYQGNINWDLFAKESDCYGVILRLGYYTTLDKKFESYLKEIKRLNIPYGIYLFSYSKTEKGALKEANFVSSMVDKYDLSPSLGIFYDIESWNSKNSNSNDISKRMYDNIVQIFINKVSSHINYKYKVKVYSGRWYAMNRLGSIAKSYVDWVAEYNKTCKYDSIYSMWQYTSRARVPGINTNVDVSYIIN